MAIVERRPIPIVQAVHSLGYLWARTVTALHVFESDGCSAVFSMSNVLALCKRADGSVAILRGGDREPGDLTALIWSGAWRQVGQFVVEAGHRPLGLLELEGELVAVCPQALHRERRGWRPLSLSGAIDRAPKTHVAAPRAGGSIYVGVNRGEWGGGLFRIDPDSGAIAPVRGSERGADRPASPSEHLDPERDAITGIAADPEHSGSVLIAVGLRHFFTERGRIARVAGDTISTVPTEVLPWTGGGEHGEAFFGIQAAGDGFWAVSTRAVYRFQGNDRARWPLPAPRQVGNLLISDALPGALLLWTYANRSHAVTGACPLVVPTETSRGR